MAFATGTATDHVDLWTKLRAFLTTNSDLVAAGENWEVVWQAPSGAPNETDVVLRGPGLAEQDTVYVGMRRGMDALADSYWMELRGMAGINPAATTYSGHINPSREVRMFTDIGSMTYWFVANGRRFIVVLKISTVFEACYAGFFLPYSLPTTYPYPMFIGGSAGPKNLNLVGNANNNSRSPINWRDQAENHRHFISPQSWEAADDLDSSAVMLSPQGEWLSVSAIPNGRPDPVGVLPDRGLNALGSTTVLSGFHFDPPFWQQRVISCLGGDAPMMPVTLVQRSPADQTWGILDGVYRCQGFENSAENIIAEGGVDHLVVQNVYRTTLNDYWAMQKG